MSPRVLLLSSLLAACAADDPAAEPDAGVVERGELTVHVGAVGAGNTTLMIHDAAGVLVDRADVAADADVTLIAGDGDTLTVARWTGSTWLGLDSIYGVDAGDAYELEIESGTPDFVTVNLPGTTAVDAYQYVAGPGRAFDFRPGDATMMSLRADDVGASGPFVVAAHAGYDLGGLLGLTAAVAEPGQPVTLPPFAAPARVDGNAGFALLVLGERVTELSILDGGEPVPVPPTMLGDALWLATGASEGTSVLSGSVIVYRAFDAIPSRWSWDVEDRRTPRLGDVTTSNRGVAWEASGDPPDAFRIQTPIDGSDTVVWKAVAAPGLRRVYAPIMPDDLPPAVPAVGRSGVAAYDHDAIDGWDEYRLAPAEWGPRPGEQIELAYDPNTYERRTIPLPPGTSRAWRIGPRF